MPLPRSWDAGVAAVVVAVAALALAGCSSSSSTEGSGSADATTAPATPSAVSSSGSASGLRQVALPQAGAEFDYQLGGAYPPPAGVRIVSRDSSANPAAGLYNICYVNAFQAQPGSESWWRSNHPDLLLHGSDGALVIDKDWNEALLDVSTDAKRGALAAIEYAWIDGCASKGFQAVEPDNLDSYTRSNGLLDASANVAFAALLAKRAHADGLAIAQKNTTELLDQRRQIGFDFAVAEQCGANDECDQYAAAYDNRVVDVEYDDAGFAAACQGWGSHISIVRRDHDVTPQGDADYVYKTC